MDTSTNFFTVNNTFDSEIPDKMCTQSAQVLTSFIFVLLFSALQYILGMLQQSESPCQLLVKFEAPTSLPYKIQDEANPAQFAFSSHQV